MTILDASFETVDKARFKSGMSRLGSSVNVVTTMFEDQRYGFTASAVCSVSDDPPTLLVCVNRSISCFHAFENVSRFCVNTLSPGQEIISDTFGGRTGAVDRFEAGAWGTGQTGAPVLENASVQFECEVTQVLDHATHRVIFGRIVNITENAMPGTLLYCQRQYLNG